MIVCEILFREVCACAAICNSIIDVEFIEKGLHDIGAAKMSSRLQSRIDLVDTAKYDAILLGYGLCNNGTAGLHSTLPIVIPRMHECISLLLGSKDRYKAYFFDNPGTFFKSSGWIERDVNPGNRQDSVTSQLGLKGSYEEYAELYGEENAEFLQAMLGNWLGNYRKVAYINDGVGNADADRNIAREYARNNHWEYEEIEGSTRLVLKLLNGEWNEAEFLIVPLGNAIVPSDDDAVIRVEKSNGPCS